MIAFIFSGQGSQYPGMGQSLSRYSPAAAAVYAAAASELGYDLLELTREQLSQTIFAQPAIVAHSLAAWQALIEVPGIRANIIAGVSGPADFSLAGFSLGEYSALGAAGVLDGRQLLALVSERARLMQTAADAVPGCMAAVLGLSDQQVLDVLDQAEFRGQVFAVNFNAPGQVVLSGLAAQMPDCLAACSRAGARRVIPLNVSGAFHTPFMSEAAEKLRSFAESLDFLAPRSRLYSNLDGQAIQPSVCWPDYLAAHLCSPVQWAAEVKNLAADGAAAFCELGPGKVLSGLVRKICPTAAVWSVDQADSLAPVIAWLTEGSW